MHKVCVRHGPIYIHTLISCGYVDEGLQWRNYMETRMFCSYTSNIYIKAQKHRVSMLLLHLVLTSPPYYHDSKRSSEHSSIVTLVTVMKSLPKKTPLTPSIRNSCRASGDPRVEEGLGKSMVPEFRTGTPGINFRQLGFGVS